MFLEDSLFTESCFEAGVSRMLSSFGTCSRLFTLLCVCVSLDIHTSVLFVTVDPLVSCISNLETDTLKNTRCVSVEVDLSPPSPPTLPGSFHSFFTLLLIYSLFYALCFSISPQVVSVAYSQLPPCSLQPGAHIATLWFTVGVKHFDMNAH